MDATYYIIQYHNAETGDNKFEKLPFSNERFSTFLKVEDYAFDNVPVGYVVGSIKKSY